MGADGKIRLRIRKKSCKKSSCMNEIIIYTDATDALGVADGAAKLCDSSNELKVVKRRSTKRNRVSETEFLNPAINHDGDFCRYGGGCVELGAGGRSTYCSLC